MANDRTGLLVLRAWIEQGSSERLRVHIRCSSDVSAGFDEHPLTLTRPEEVCATVDEWLAKFLREAEQSD